MGLRNRLQTAAARARVPLFAIGGAGARDSVQDLRLRSEVTMHGTPRSANVLLLSGDFTESGVAALRRLHDQMSTPRLTVRWGRSPIAGLPDTHILPGEIDEIIPAIVGLHESLLRWELASEAPLLPDIEPAEWRNVGPYGQGGKGMTGGVPYGRPMAERGADRDGLQLDRLPVTLGPWLPALPPGLSMRAAFQGDLVQEITVGPSGVSGHVDLLFHKALDHPAAIAELEMARARHHLRWLAESLRLLGLGPLGVRALRLAHRLTPGDAAAVEKLIRAVRRSGAFLWGLGSVGHLDPAVTTGLGPVSRAGGRDDDARMEDPGYLRLDFTPVTVAGGDVRARWEQRIAEIAQSLQLAVRAGNRMAFGSGVVETPRGRLEEDNETPSGRLMALLPEALAGLEWGDAVACLASLDLDPAEAAASPRADDSEAA